MIPIKDANGAIVNMQNVESALNGNNFITVNKPFELAVTMGQVANYSTIDKFGLNPLVTSADGAEDVWEGGGIYTFDTFGTAPIVSLASSSASDLVNIRVSGLDITGAYVEQTLTLTGTTRVALTTALWRVFRMENVGTSDLVGNVFCYTGTGAVPSVGDAEVRAIITNGYNQTLMAIYTIPLGKYGFLYEGEVGVQWQSAFLTTTEYARMLYQSRRNGEVFRTKKVITCSTSGSSNFQDKRFFPDIIPPLTDIKITVDQVSSDMGAWATFDILLVDESEII